MNKFILNTSLVALALASFSIQADASKIGGDDSDNPFSYQSTSSSNALVKYSPSERKVIRAKRGMHKPVEDMSIVPFGTSQGFNFSIESDIPNPFSSSYAASSVPVSDDAEEVFEQVHQPSIIDTLDEQAMLGVTHLQHLIDNDQDLSVVLAMKAPRALFDHPEIFETFFASNIADSIKRNGFFSLNTTHILGLLNEDQKAGILAPYGYRKLFQAPVKPKTERFKAFALDGFNGVVDTVKSTVKKKRGYDEMTKASDDFDADKMQQVKRKRNPKDFKTRAAQLDFISTALKSHVEETFKQMNPYFVRNSQALSDLVDATQMLKVFGVKMIGYYVTPHQTVQWDDGDVMRLNSALQQNRIMHLDLSGNRITSKLLPLMHWNGLQTLDLNSNYIDSFGPLLQSNIQTLRLNGNYIEKISEDSKPTAPNYTLERLDLGLNHFENSEMSDFLRVLHLLPNLKVLNLATTPNHFLSSSTLTESLDVSHPSLEVLGLSRWSLDETA
ncbi:MAG: hypothetical protein ACTHJ4_02445, partial [Candidatus Nucleicultricaceae bacterium]